MESWIGEVTHLPNELKEYLSTNYQNLKSLNSGAYGTLLQADDLQKERRVVIKVVDLNPSSLHPTKELRFSTKYFKAEMKVHRRLSKSKQKNMTRLYKAKILKLSCASSSFYSSSEVTPSEILQPELKTTLRFGIIVMERMGMDLMDHLLDTGHLAPSTRRSIFKEISEAIHYCHSKGYAHLDIKPENILLRKTGRYIESVKLCDFGFARKIKDNDPSKFAKLAIPKFGTLNYLPPECIERFDANTPLQLEKVDVYSLGVILYVMISGRFPKVYNEAYIAYSESEHMEEIKDCVSSDCFELLSLLLHDDPSQRPSMHEVLQHPYLN